MTNSIRPLPSSVVAAIAAGETIERPCFVIKELIENSLDAGASSIDIAVKAAGLELIQVTDNGAGISAEDLAIAALKHTTSKINSLADLDSLDSLGFRGEALASIGAVSSLSIRSRPAEYPLGHVIEVNYGQAQEVTPQGLPIGTTVLVKDLFNKIPVRKKFLSKKQTESRLIADIVTQQAISNPKISFNLRHNQRQIISTPADQNLQQRITSLFNLTTAEQLLPISFEHSFISITGFIGTPQLARKQLRHQYLTLNGRPVSHTILAGVIKKAYGSLLEPAMVPWFAIQVTLPSSVFDVNVHPRKEKVAFMDEAQVISLINKAVVASLSKYNSGYRYQVPGNADTSLSFHDKQTPLPALHHQLKSAIAPWSVKKLEGADQIQQIANTYLVIPDEDNFSVIDQHAAHERILFEQFKEAFKNQNNIKSLELTTSHLLDLTASDQLLWDENNHSLEKIGFQWESFGGSLVKITHIPPQLKDHKLAEIMPRLLDDIATGQPLELTTQTHQTLAYLACRSAIMAGDKLTQDERQNLIIELAKTTNNSTCPHGRPTRISFSKQQLDKLFHRI
jgi:DNA mismatch repair protein MutL